MTETDSLLIDAQRSRWRASRNAYAMIDPGERKFGSARTAARIEHVGIRVLIQPRDPATHALDFDEAFWEWFRALAPSGSWRNVYAGEVRATVEAACVASVKGDSSWRRYLALTRSGTIDAAVEGSGVSYTGPAEVTILSLTSLVQYLVTALDFGSAALGRYPRIEGPWEISVAVPHTKGAALAQFAEGWGRFENWSDSQRLQEDALLLTREVQDLSPDCLDSVAKSLCGQLVNAWGITEPRFVDRETREFGRAGWG